MIITEIQYFFSKIIRFQAIFKDTVEFTCALEFKISSQPYNLATILAEKLETVISRSDQNTRPRDYYDVYILTKLQAENIDFPALGAALMATASKRGSDSILQDYRAIVEAVRNSEIMRRQWDNYRKDFDYASTISFDEVCDAVASTMDTLITNNFFN